MDKDKAQRLRTELLEAMKPVADKHGVTATFMSGKYSASDFTVKLCLVETSSVPEGAFGAQSVYMADFIKHPFKRHGLNGNAIGKTFCADGRLFKVVGLLSKARTRPIVCSCGDKLWRFDVARVRNCLIAEITMNFAPQLPSLETLAQGGVA
jgi:hypothetical protein